VQYADAGHFKNRYVIFVREGETIHDSLTREQKYVEQCTGRKICGCAVEIFGNWAYVDFKFE